MWETVKCLSKYDPYSINNDAPIHSNIAAEKKLIWIKSFKTDLTTSSDVSCVDVLLVNFWTEKFDSITRVCKSPKVTFDKFSLNVRNRNFLQTLEPASVHEADRRCKVKKKYIFKKSELMQKKVISSNTYV